MRRLLALGSAWDAALVERLERTLPGWTIMPDAARTPHKAREATVLVPLHMTVERELLSGSEIRLVQQFGVGLDNVDLRAAADLGVAVANAPSAVSGMAASVAEGAVSLVLSCARLPSLRARNLAEGRWNWTMPLNLGLAGRRAGLVGYGSIGRAIARRLTAFDMRVAAVTRSGVVADPAGCGLDWVGGMDRIGELIASSDLVIVCAPLTPETRGLFDRTLIGTMKSSSSLINVGRGAIVDETALLRALDEGRLHAAGLDTIRAEPPPRDSPLLTHPRVVLTPHDAGVTDVAFDGVAGIIRGNLARLEAGEPLRHRVA